MKRAAGAFLRPLVEGSPRSLPRRRALSSSASAGVSSSATGSAVELGIVPAHVGFERGMAPSAAGRLPRTPETGELALLTEMRGLVEECPVDLQRNEWYIELHRILLPMLTGYVASTQRIMSPVGRY